MVESITLHNTTPRAYALPARKKDGASFGSAAVLPAGGTLEVPRWYAEELAREPAWRRRFERGDVTDGRSTAKPAPSDEMRLALEAATEGRQRAEARVRELEAELDAMRLALDAPAAGRQRAEARVRELEAEIDGVRATTRKQVAELEAQLAEARKPAPKVDEKPKTEKPKKDEKPEG
jgi:hypothetical protein